MTNVLRDVDSKYMKKAVVDIQSGDTVRVHQRIKEGNKERIQVFQGLVIKTTKPNSHLSRITVRRVASGIGVEKSFLMHSPLVVKVEVSKRSKVRRNYLSYMRARTGKSARLSGVDFDKTAVNTVPVEEEPEEAKVAEEKPVQEEVALEEVVKAEEPATPNEVKETEDTADTK